MTPTLGQQPSVWRLALPPDESDRALRFYVERSCVAVGWGLVGDLRRLEAAAPRDIERALCNVPRYRHLENLAAGAQSLWDLWREMRRGDLVVLASRGCRRQVMEITGDYEWVATTEFGDHQHRRPAVALDMSPDELWAQGRCRLTVGGTKRPLPRVVLPV